MVCANAFQHLPNSEKGAMALLQKYNTLPDNLECSNSADLNCYCWISQYEIDSISTTSSNRNGCPQPHIRKKWVPPNGRITDNGKHRDIISNHFKLHRIYYLELYYYLKLARSDGFVGVRQFLRYRRLLCNAANMIAIVLKYPREQCWQAIWCSYNKMAYKYLQLRNDEYYTRKCLRIRKNLYTSGKRSTLSNCPSTKTNT